MRRTGIVGIGLAGALLAPVPSAYAAEPRAYAAATCDDHPNQASAQRAKDTRDADGDGIYCESLPCPCLKPGAGGGGGGDRDAARRKARAKRRAAERRRRAAIRRRRAAIRREARLREQRLRRQINSADARVVDVIDGDTVAVTATGTPRRRYTVRLIGIDTPETVKPGTPVECGGKEATSHMLSLTFSAPQDTDVDGLLDREGGYGARVMLTKD